MKPRVFMLIAGEPSGDLLAAELVKALKQSPRVRANPFPPEFFGAGGSGMAAEGVELALDLTRHSVIGVSDVLKKYWEFKRIFDQLFALALERRPDVIICVDFSGFNRRFAHGIKEYVRAQHGSFNNWAPRIVQYVSPQVWASRPGRVYQIARDYDLLLSIFPFEKEWYAARVPQLRVEFVGHPLCDRFNAQHLKLKVQGSSPLVVLLPGSREGELKRHLPVMLKAGHHMNSQVPLRWEMVLPNDELVEQARRFPAPWPLKIQAGGLQKSLAEADLAIASTGTVTMECAWFGVPTVALYKTSWTTYLIGRQMVTVKYLAMPNLLTDEEIYPEFVQHTATPEHIARAALELLNDPERRNATRKKLAKIVESLGPPGAAGRASEAILNLFE
jgi:lipid-A-disaccharide synthase